MLLVLFNVCVVYLLYFCFCSLDLFFCGWGNYGEGVGNSLECYCFVYVEVVFVELVGDWGFYGGDV